MVDQRIDYTSSDDNDIRESDESISPFNDGERVVESILRRPGESLRSRTEVDRTSIEDLLYRMDSDVRWIITGGDTGGVGAILPQITAWDPDIFVGPPTRGAFIISDDIVIQPLVTPGADTLGSTFVWMFDDGTDSGTLTVSSKLLAAEGGNVLSFEIEYTTDTGVLTIEKLDSVSGKIQRIKILVSDDASKSMTDLKTALETGTDVTDRFTLVWGGNWNATEIDTGQTVPTAGIYSPSDKPWEREFHLIQPTDLVTFFSNDANKLKDGETLGIYYPFMADPDKFLEPGSGTDDGRRQACVTNTNVTVPAASLVNLGREPDKLQYCIPICKRIADDLYFVDGTVIKGTLLLADPDIYFGEHGYTLARYSASTGASQLGVAADAETGGASSDRWSIPAENLQDVLGKNTTGLQDFINDKASLNALETVTSKWTFNENVIVDASGGTGTNLHGTHSTGKGTGSGLWGVGGSDAGIGVTGVGGTGASSNSGGGIVGTGGVGATTYDAGRGVEGEGGTAVDGDAGDGIRGLGGLATGSGASGHGVHGTGAGDASGVVGIGGVTAGTGVFGNGTGGGIGVKGQGNTGGVGGEFTGGSIGAAVRLVPRSGVPGTLSPGVMWVDSGSKDVFARPGGTNVCLSHIKAWATVQVSSGTPSLLDSYNVLSVVQDPIDSKDLKITFTDAFANTDYAMLCTMNIAYLGTESNATAKAASVISVSGWNVLTTAQVDFSAGGTDAMIYLVFTGERSG